MATRHLDCPWPRSAARLVAAAVLLLTASAAVAQDAAPAPVLTAQGSQLHLPAARGESLPLVILLPYTGSTARRLLEWYYADSLLPAASAQGYAVLLPALAGRRADYADGSAWRATLERYQRLLAADVDELVRLHGIDPGRVVLAGFSMGGDLAWATLQRDPQRYAGAIVMGSRVSYRDEAAMTELAARGARLFLYMGAAENPQRLAGMQSAIQALTRAGVEHRYERAPGGHLPAPPVLFNDALRYVLRDTAVNP